MEFNVYSSTGDANLQAIVSEAIEGVKEIAAPMYRSILIHQTTLEVHGMLSGVATHEYLRRFVRIVPWSQSEREGVNLGFNVGGDPGTGRLSAAVVVAKSGVLAEGLYVQIAAGYDGALSLNEFVSRYANFVGDALEKLELTEAPK
jgi:hypothetical protein